MEKICTAKPGEKKSRFGVKKDLVNLLMQSG